MKHQPLRLYIFAALMLLTSFPARSIGLKIVKEYPQTLLAAAKTWDIDVYDDDWAFFATQEGLVQYDGTQSDMFYLHNRYSLRSVTMDRDKGRLYVGGINEFGYFYPSSERSLDYVCLSDSVGDDRHIGNMWGIYPYQGTVYVQGDTQVIIYDESEGTHSLINTDCKLDCSALIDGVLWLGTDRGLKFLLGKMVVDAPGAERLKGTRIRNILQFQNSLLVVTASDGVFRYDRSTLTPLEGASQAALALGEVFSADVNDHVLVLGSVENGMGVVNLTSGAMVRYNEGNGLPNNTVLTVKFDSRGDLWAGMDLCIAKVRMTTPVETFNNKSLQIGSGYVLETVGNKMYLGTNRGLFCTDYIPGADLSNAVFQRVDGTVGQVWGLRKVNGALFCCHDRGLFQISGTQSRRIGDVTGVWDVQPYVRESGKLMIGTYSGLFILEESGSGWRIERRLNGFDDSCYNFVQESKDVIWNCDGEEGLYRLLLDSKGEQVKKMENYRATADNVPLTSNVSLSRIDNDIFAATAAGIYKFNSSEKSFEKDEQLSLLLGSPQTVRRVKKMGGWLYALTDKELIQGDPAGILGIKRIPLREDEGPEVHDGDLLFGVAPRFVAYPTRFGFSFFDFSDPYPGGKGEGRERLGKVTINSFGVTTPKDSIVYKGNFLGKKDPITLKYSENSIKAVFGGGFPDAVGTLYSCRLNGEKWSEPSASNVKEFTGLKEGDYTFEVRAINPDGSESFDVIEFRVLPPWWRSIWATAVYILLIGFGIWGAVLLERRRMRLQEAALVKEKEEELAVQQANFEWESKEKDHKIIELEKEKLDHELRHKAQEMANAMMNLTRKNETLQTVKRDLQNILPMLPKSSGDVRRAIVELQGKVTADIKSDETLNRVVEEFDLVHNDFIKRLRERFPEITNNEMLMCAYIKMNISTKEIAPLLNISVRGVETMRYRLRKKFELEREQSLTEFLQSMELR